MNAKYLIGTIGVCILVGCGAQPKTDPGNSTLATYKAICEITTAQGAVMACADFAADAPANHTTCTDLQQRYSSYGAAGYEYVAVTTANASTSCALTNPTLVWGVSCGFSDRTLRYYNSFPSGFNPINDCTAQSGSAFPNEN